MKKLLLIITGITLACSSTSKMNAQTAGTLTFTFMPVTKSPGYQGTKNVLAVWVQSNTGAFIKTKMRYAGGSTSDHLPAWAANAGCSSSANCLGANCNTVDGTTGATLASFTAKSVTWDGKKGAAATGTLQPDGVYQVSIQETWNHGTAGTAMTSYTFTKGATPFHQEITADPNFGNILIDWNPSLTGIDEVLASNPIMNIYPNPTEDSFNVDYTNASMIKVINTLGVIVYQENVDRLSNGTKNIDLSNYSNGVYFINVSNETSSINHKLILNK